MTTIDRAVSYASELSRARVFGTTPPTTDELEDVLSELADISECSPECEDNRENLSDFTHAVERLADADDMTMARGALLRILEITKGITWAERNIDGICKMLTLQPLCPRCLEESTTVPLCAASMGCLCAGHARGNPSDSACDTSER